MAEALRVANNSFEETSGLTRMPLSELSRKVSSHFDIKEEDLRSPKKKRSVTQAKSVFGYLSIKKMGYSGREVGKFLNMRGYSAIRRAEAGEIIIDTGSLALTSATEIHQGPPGIRIMGARELRAREEYQTGGGT